MARIFIFVGHPAETSFCKALADAYQQGAEDSGATVARMDLNAMSFDPDLSFGYKQRKTLEPDLELWREHLLAAQTFAVFYPQWWGGMPAKMKGVFDRAYLPGFAMRYHDKDPFWDRLLNGRDADVFLTADTPAWWDRYVYGQPAARQIKRLVLEFAGIRPVRLRQLATMKLSKPRQRARWLDQARMAGARAARQLTQSASAP